MRSAAAGGGREGGPGGELRRHAALQCHGERPREVRGAAAGRGREGRALSKRVDERKTAGLSVTYGLDLV